MGMKKFANNYHERARCINNNLDIKYLNVQKRAEKERTYKSD